MLPVPNLTFIPFIAMKVLFLTVTRGEVGVDNEGKRGRVYRNNSKGHMDKTKGEG